MKHLRRVAAIASATILSFAGLAACGSSDDSGASSSGTTASTAPSSSTSSGSKSPSKTPAKAEAAVITIKDFKFSGPSSVAPGTKITVKNEDTAAHTVTADSGSAFDVAVAANASKTFTAPAKAGAYKFHCTYHANMHATLTVS